MSSYCSDRRPAAVGVNLNTASAKEIEALPGIGRQRASDIIAARPHRDLADMVARRVIPASVAERLSGRVSFR